AEVPAEWTSKKGQSNGDALKGIEECKKITTAVADAKKDNRARSREFSDPVPEHATTAENAVYAFSNKASATKFMRTYQGSAAQACFDKLATEITKDRPTAGPPSAAPITDLQGVGSEATGHQISATLTQDGGTAPLYVVVVRVGRAAMGFGFTNVDGRIPQGPDIVNAVVQRVSATEA